MVLLDYFCANPKIAKENITVAHFNHGTRPSADTDEAFAKAKAQEYGVAFISKKLFLGEGVSESDAREARYDFLKFEATRRNATLTTAHHLNDLTESILINLTRGTGWRGLTPMYNAPTSTYNIYRPFLELRWTKADILKYAAAHNITFREDPTNSEDNYLRNRIREQLRQASQKNTASLQDLSYRQSVLRQEIEEIATQLISDKTINRAWFQTLDDSTALELLYIYLKQNGISATTPQLKNFLEAIRTYTPGKLFNLPKNHLIKIEKTCFYLKK